MLLAVLREPTPENRLAVEETFNDTVWSGDKPSLQILDTVAWDALHQLAAAGMITIHARATRPLLPKDGQPPLTPEQLAHISDLRATAAKKRRAAEALAAAGLPEEAAPMLRAAEDAETQARAIAEGKMPVSDGVSACLG